MKYLMIIPFTAALLASQQAFAQAEACTPEVITAKAEELAERVNQLTEGDPQRAAEINKEMRQMELKRTAEELGNECEAYDQRLKHVEAAERRADIPPAETQRPAPQ